MRLARSPRRLRSRTGGAVLNGAIIIDLRAARSEEREGERDAFSKRVVSISRARRDFGDGKQLAHLDNSRKVKVPVCLDA